MRWPLVQPFARLAAVALLAAFAFGTAAHADPETGSRIDQHRGSVGFVDGDERERSIRVLNIYGRCVARNQRRPAEDILALPLYTSEQDAAVRRMLGGEDGCLGVGDRELRFPPRLLIGAMAEWFVEHGGTEAYAAINRISDERLTEIGLEPRTGYEDFALCVARRDPAAVRALVLTEPASDREGSAVTQLMPHLGPCLPAGRSVTFDRTSLRGILAVGLYRLLATPAATQPQA